MRWTRESSNVLRRCSGGLCQPLNFSRQSLRRSQTAATVKHCPMISEEEARARILRRGRLTAAAVSILQALIRFSCGGGLFRATAAADVRQLSDGRLRRDRCSECARASDCGLSANNRPAKIDNLESHPVRRFEFSRVLRCRVELMPL